MGLDKPRKLQVVPGDLREPVMAPGGVATAGKGQIHSAILYQAPKLCREASYNKNRIIVGRQSACKAIGSPSDAPAARRNLKLSRREQTYSGLSETRPKIVIFGCFQVRPASDFDITVRPDPKIGSMNMGMSSICVDRVTCQKTRRYFGAMLLKTVDRNNAGYCLDPG